jgi:DNA-binding NarL/FixJ family response regulator
VSIRVLIVDDDDVVRISLRRGFLRHKDVEVIGEATNGEEAVVAVLETDPDVVVMDVHMPKLSGLDATVQLREQGVETPILFLTADARTRALAQEFEHVSTLLKAEAGIAETVAAVRAMAKPS